MTKLSIKSLGVPPLIFISGICLGQDLDNTAGPDLSGLPNDLSDKFIATQKHQTNNALTLSRDWIRASQKPYINSDGRVIFAFGATMPELVCKPRMICDIKLQEGERLVSKPKSGDLAQWVISDSVSGKGEKKSHHVAVKPMVDGLSNNVVIYTDRRTYSISIKSSDIEYIPMIGFAYNDPPKEVVDIDAIKKDEMKKNNSTVIDGKEVLGNNLDFNYSITGDDVKWRPVRVFNDDKKTYIDVNKSVSSGELPSLLITDSDTRGQIINYRYVPGDSRYIVDGVFDSAFLAVGVGRKQKKVIIRRGASDGFDYVDKALGLKGTF